MAIRIKMRLDAVNPRPVGGVHALFNCVFDEKSKQAGEANGAAKFTIDDPAAIAELVVGKFYTVEITAD